MKKIIIACSKQWFFKNQKVKNFIKKNKIIVIYKDKYLKINNLKNIKPDVIFFPHWSYKVKEEILNNFLCIGFHTAPLPYGRGGSPIQNLIIRNFKIAPVCAIKMTNKFDAGPIFLKENVSLSGNLDAIFNRISLSIIQMIKIFMKKKIKPIKQKGKVLKFKRINEKQSNIKKENTLKKIFDKIRMLDADEYPNAYLKTNKLKIIFRDAVLEKKFIKAKVKIFKN